MTDAPWWAWVVAGVLLAPVLWFLFTTVIGVTAPPQLSGRKWLEKRLMGLGVSPAQLGDAFLAELVQHAIECATAMKHLPGESFNDNMMVVLDDHAFEIAAIVRGEVVLRRLEGSTYDRMKRHGLIP